MQFKIYNEDCISGAKKYFADESVDLEIYDPPFGINESAFGSQYNRDEDNVIKGYVEAPADYLDFTRQWLTEAKRILKPNGSIYIISGWSNLLDVLSVIKELDLFLINHIIWKYNFGVFTKKKYVSSHYHILFLKKSKNAKITFNTESRFELDDRDENAKSLLYRDLEDVWVIKKEYAKGKMKNKNKLPEALVRKMVQYSSNEGDIVCDFFMGNFTTAFASLKSGRIPVGFEKNKEAFEYHMPLMKWQAESLIAHA
tara:strand:- start:6143 stop:6910 length:768 start_codon:yes stop_codon:yes gene_type:complete